ncbi:MAG: hypothetical protein ACK4UK_09580 [Flavobacterium sp.]
MQKYLHLLNFCLNVVVNDICGLTELLIIRATYERETNTQKLAALRHGNCRKRESEIALTLKSNGRKEYLFALKHKLENYDHLQNKIAECDKIPMPLDQQL